MYILYFVCTGCSAAMHKLRERLCVRISTLAWILFNMQIRCLLSNVCILHACNIRSKYTSVQVALKDILFVSHSFSANDAVYEEQLPDLDRNPAYVAVNAVVEDQYVIAIPRCDTYL